MKQSKKKPENINEYKGTSEPPAGEEVKEVMKEAKEIEEETKADKEENAAQEIADLQKKYDEMNDKYLRLYSEFDNFRKRMLKEKIELSKTASADVITDFLTILDDFERAIAAFENVKSVEPLKEGTLLIYNKFKNSLSQKGLAEIDAMGKVFDTDYHEAIANVPAASDDQKNKVLDVTLKGYTLNGKVIRFAKVVVGN